VAAAGGKVAKHGNRSVSSSTGSADLLEAAGINLNVTPEQVTDCVKDIGVGFMFAPAHHSAMKHAIGPRKELAQRTIFNMLGPMTNPAGVKRQVIGVFKQSLCRPIAEVLQRLGSVHVLVVHSDDGLDEISVAGATHVAELKNGEVSEYDIQPGDFNVECQNLSGLTVNSAKQSLALIEQALGGETASNAKKARDIIALNAGAAIYASGLASSLKEGVEEALGVISSGAALQKMTDLKEKTQSF
jgi:anthranilate phosphoribosyltransferase